MSVIFLTRRERSSKWLSQSSLDELKAKDDDDSKINDFNDDQVPALPQFLEHVPYVYVKPDESDVKKKAREFYRIADARRTVRFFSDENVPKSVIHDLIRSAGNFSMFIILYQSANFNIDGRQRNFFSTFRIVPIFFVN